MSCLAEVPEETSEWKPDIAPQAMVININGIRGGASEGLRLTAGATIWKFGFPRAAANTPAKRRKRATKSWWEFI
jgi:hypothetical protein